jgi:hypothetical protein
MKKMQCLAIVAMFFLLNENSTIAQSPFMGLGIGKTSKGYTTASFWGREIFLLNKAGLSLSPYLRVMNQEYEANEIYFDGPKTEHDEQVIGCILNFNEEKHPGFENLSLILAIGRYQQREHKYLFIADDEGYGVGSSYIIENEKEGISLEAGMAWRFQFKRVKNFCGNINYTANTYSLFIMTIGTSFVINYR